MIVGIMTQTCLVMEIDKICLAFLFIHWIGGEIIENMRSYTHMAYCIYLSAIKYSHIHFFLYVCALTK